MSFVKLGEEIILTLLWQSGASESATVCFVISLILAIDCLNTEFCALCVCERESHSVASCVCVCVCVCSCVCSRVWEGDKVTQPLLVCTYEIHHGVCHTTLFPLLMVKLRTLLTVFTLVLKAEACDYGKGNYISDACLWFSANHNALGQLANQSRLCLSEGGAL